MKNEVKIPQRIAIFFFVINLIKLKGKDMECYIFTLVMKN